jgi:hypothetical protein
VRQAAPSSLNVFDLTSRSGYVCHREFCISGGWATARRRVLGGKGKGPRERRARTLRASLLAMSDESVDQSLAPREQPPDQQQQAHTADLRRYLESAIGWSARALPLGFRLAREGVATPEVAECLEISLEPVLTCLRRQRLCCRVTLR